MRLHLLKVLILFTLGIFSFNSSAIVFGNAKTLSEYGDKVVIEIEVFNLYSLTYGDMDFSISDLVNIEVNKEKYPVSIKKSFIQSNGLGWITIVTKEPIYNGILKFNLVLKSNQTKGARAYNLSFYGNKKNRPSKTCKIKSIRMKCVNEN